MWSVWVQTLVWFHTKARQCTCAIYQFLLLFFYIITFETVRLNINLQECCKLASLENFENRKKRETCMRVSLTEEVRASRSQLLGSSHWPDSLWASQSQEQVHTGQPVLTSKLWIRASTFYQPSDGTTTNRREERCIMTVFEERRKDCECKGSKALDLQKAVLPDPLFI